MLAPMTNAQGIEEHSMSQVTPWSTGTIEPANCHQFIERTLNWERELVRRAAKWDALGRGEGDYDTDAARKGAESWAASCREGIRECLQARACVRSLEGEAPALIVLTLSRTGLHDFASAFATGDWDTVGLF